MEKIFTIAVREYFGLHNSGTSILQFKYDHEQVSDDYYIIDMALAENSALNDCVPREKLRAYPQQWLPMATNS